jgi:hypothetical protein
MKTCGEVRIQLHSFLTSKIDEDERQSAASLGPFIPGKTAPAM